MKYFESIFELSLETFDIYKMSFLPLRVRCSVSSLETMEQRIFM
jgi:hypothetical protein